jgi:hypothetical protein
MMNPTRLRGFRLAYGSWKIIISSRRIGRISARWRCVMSRPSKMIRPSVGSSRRITQRAIVDLPQPDSPTTPSVSPFLTVNVTPSTAFTEATSFWKMIPRVTGKCLTRFSTTRRSSPDPFVAVVCGAVSVVAIAGDYAATVPSSSFAASRSLVSSSRWQRWRCSGSVEIGDRAGCSVLQISIT